MTRHELAMLCVSMLSFGAATIMGACIGEIGSTTSACPAPGVDPPAVEPTTCPAPVEDPCWRYRIELVNKDNPQVRAAYIAAFGDACYLADNANRTFDCFYQKWEKACEDAVKIGAVSGNAPYDPGYKCQPDGVGNYTLQIGPDVSNVTHIYFENAPRQTPLVEVDGVEVEVNGPYRNLPELKDLWPGNNFYCNSGMIGADGKALNQRAWILQVNRNAHKNDAGVGEIHSDLAGFKWPCKVMNANCEEVWTECEEPLVLSDPLSDPENNPPPFHPGLIARVHHVVPMNDKRSCSWGTNSNKNAAVISHALNEYLTNDNPPAEEVKRLNNSAAYTP